MSIVVLHDNIDGLSTNERIIIKSPFLYDHFNDIVRITDQFVPMSTLFLKDVMLYINGFKTEVEKVGDPLRVKTTTIKLSSKRPEHQEGNNTYFELKLDEVRKYIIPMRERNLNKLGI